MDKILDYSLRTQLVSATVFGWFALAFIFVIAYKLGKDEQDR